MNSTTRPIFINLLQIRLPITGILSILHRIAGVMLTLTIPFSIYLMDLSLQNESGFQQALAILNATLFRFFVFFVLVGLFHHLLAGVRCLLIDIDIGVNKSIARRSCWLVFTGDMLFALWLLVKLL